LYKERNEERREKFLEEMAFIDPEKVFFLDEFGFDTHQKYEYSWAKRGEKVYAEKSGSRGARVNTIACLNHKGGLVASFTFEGSCNSEVFDVYLSKVLIPTLKEGSVIVMDNASFHTGSNAKDLLEKHGCKLKYLPPYSPDLNPIENYWFPLKNDLKKRFLEAVKNPFETVTEVVRLRST